MGAVGSVFKHYISHLEYMPIYDLNCYVKGDMATVATKVGEPRRPLYELTRASLIDPTR